MALLDDVGTVLIAAGVADAVAGGAVGWYLQKGLMTDEQDQVVTVMEGVAKTSDHSSGTMHDYPAVQVLVRGALYDYTAARTKAEAVVTALDNVAVGTCVYFYLRQAPLAIGLDPNRRPMFSLNFDLMKART